MPLYYYLAIINVATFIICGIDKNKAKKSKWRHKTKHNIFRSESLASRFFSSACGSSFKKSVRKIPERSHQPVGLYLL